MPTIVRISDARIAQMNVPGGIVHRYVTNKSRTVAAFAYEFAPKRTGRMAASIRYDVTTRGARGCTGSISVNTYYAKWVMGGTRGPIFPLYSENLWVPVAPGAFRRVNREYVSGQRPQPFLTQALSYVMKTSLFVIKRR